MLEMAGREIRRGILKEKLLEKCKCLGGTYTKKLSQKLLRDCLLIRVSRVRTPDRALGNRCFCGQEAAGMAVFFVQQ